jgi:mannose-6-phosphate isomerase-like protein (cupin superfamily)
MNNSIVINLREAGRVDPGHWLTGPLRVIQLVTVGPTEQVEIAAQGAEHTLFTLRGTGTVTHADTTVDLGPEVAVTLPLGTHVRIVAGQAGLEYFQASLEVAPETIAAPPDGGQGGER